MNEIRKQSPVKPKRRLVKADAKKEKKVMGKDQEKVPEVVVTAIKAGRKSK